MLLPEPYHLVTLLPLLVAAGHCLGATAGGGDDSQQFAYNGFTGVNLTLDGAVVTSKGVLVLTDDRSPSKGHAFHPSLLSFRTGSVRSFSTIFVFAIVRAGECIYGDLYSGGMAFFVSTSKKVLSTALSNQFLGLLNGTNNGNHIAHIFAVELDTLQDTEFHDIDDNHVGVDIDSLVSCDSTNAGFYDDGTGHFYNLSLRSGEAMQVWVDYDSSITEITMSVAPLGVARCKRPLLQTTVDLYKGVIRKPGMKVAVKRMSHDSRQGVKEFIAEVVSIGRLRHRNITQLLGYCRRKGELLLVYDYMENGSLDKYLHTRNGPTLCWSERYSIIKGVASSLLYLHEEWEQVVIHRDMKASNVLLDSKMNGRLGDFGLARIYDHATVGNMP